VVALRRSHKDRPDDTFKAIFDHRQFPPAQDILKRIHPTIWGAGLLSSKLTNSESENAFPGVLDRAA
jgi:hypothetical protein